MTGKVTGSKIKSLDADPYWLQNVSYYDDKYRVIQSIADNQRGGQHRVSNIYDFVGKVLLSKTSVINRAPVWNN